MILLVAQSAGGGGGSAYPAPPVNTPMLIRHEISKT